MAQVQDNNAVLAANPAKRVKLTGRAFYESIGSPNMIVAPMVDRSEFAWRLLTRSYLDEQQSKQLLAYSPMFHARLFKEQSKFRDAHFQPTKDSLASKQASDAPRYLDGRPDIDRPLFVQFCANKTEDFFEAAQYVAPYCDAVDLNLGCPQGIARSGHYGAFLQEDWTTIHKLIRKLRDELDVPVTAKFRILETKEKTLDYAKMILDAGASIIAVHGRQRHQKGHNTGVADWQVIRYLRDNLPSETVMFANGNILNNGDLKPCLDATKADGIMSAEGNLSDPTIFAEPPKDAENREYWRDPSNPSIAGYRIDGVFRRYLDIIHRYVLEQEPPSRPPLYVPGDINSDNVTNDEEHHINGTPNNEVEEHMSSRTKRPADTEEPEDTDDNPVNAAKKQKTKRNNKGKNLTAVHNPNLKSMQGHLFQLLRTLIGSHIPVRDALAKSRAGDIQAFENVLTLVEDAVKKGLDEHHASRKDTAFSRTEQVDTPTESSTDNVQAYTIDTQNSEGVRERCRRPFWICQPHIRPLPEEAVELGAMTLSKKDKALAAEAGSEYDGGEDRGRVEGKSQAIVAQNLQGSEKANGITSQRQEITNELPRNEALACG